MGAELMTQITDGPNDAVKIVRFSGEMDEASLESVRTELATLLSDQSVATVIFDLAGLEFINSKGIGYLVSVHTHLAKNKRKLIVVAAQDPVMDVISLVGLTSIIAYYPTIEEVTL